MRGVLGTVLALLSCFLLVVAVICTCEDIEVWLKASPVNNDLTRTVALDVAMLVIGLAGALYGMTLADQVDTADDPSPAPRAQEPAPAPPPPHPRPTSPAVTVTTSLQPPQDKIAEAIAKTISREPVPIVTPPRSGFADFVWLLMVVLTGACVLWAAFPILGIIENPKSSQGAPCCFSLSIGSAAVVWVIGMVPLGIIYLCVKPTAPPPPK